MKFYQIFLRNSTEADPHQLEIAGCEKFCALDDLKQILMENIPGEREKDCMPLNTSYKRGNFDF